MIKALVLAAWLIVSAVTAKDLSFTPSNTKKVGSSDGKYDFIIVGTGPGGAAAARWLSESGKHKVSKQSQSRACLLPTASRVWHRGLFW